MGRFSRRSFAALAFSVLLAVPASAMPGGVGFGAGPGCFFVLFSFAGAAFGALALGFYALRQAVEKGPHRRAWRVVLAVLVTVVLAFLWYVRRV